MNIRRIETPIKDLFIIETDFLRDERGFFLETWSKRDFAQAELVTEFVQENHSRSKKGVLRGLHYQDMTTPLTKLVRCTFGKIFDVAVDLRKNSPSFGKWFSVELSDENMKMLYVPVGFAHGFQTLSESADIQYKQTGYYTPTAEGTIAWNDEELSIPWPMQNPLLSEKDQYGMSFKEYYSNPIFF